MINVLNPKQLSNSGSPFRRIFLAFCLLLILSATSSAMAAQTDPETQAEEETTNQAPDYTEEMAEATEEVNTNDPTAAAISIIWLGVF